MRTLFFLYLVSFFTLFSCSGEQHVLRVAGVYDKGINIDVYLIARDGEKVDTLGRGKVLDGYFSIVGKAAPSDSVFVEAYMKTGYRVTLLQLPKGEGNYLVYLNVDTRLNWVQEGEELYNDMNTFYESELHLQQVSQKLKNECAQDKERAHAVFPEYVKEIERYMQDEHRLLDRNSASPVAAVILMGQINSFTSGFPMHYFNLQRGMDLQKYLLQEWEWLMRYYRNTISDDLKPWLKERYFPFRLGKMSTDMQMMQVDRLMDIGQLAPNFTMTDLNGKPFKLHDVKVKIKYLDFWSSLCMVCRAQMPGVMKVYEEFRDQGFEVVAVSTDDKESRWKKAIETDKLNFTYHGLFDRNLVKFIYGASLGTYLLDEHNNIIGKNLHGEELHEAVRKYLN